MIDILPNKPEMGPPLPAFLEVRWPKWIKRIESAGRERFGDEGHIEKQYEEFFLGRYLIKEYHLAKDRVTKERAKEIANSLGQYGYDIVHRPHQVGDEWVFSTSEPAD